MTTTAPSALKSLLPVDYHSAHREDFNNYRRTRALRSGDALPPPILVGTVGWTMGEEGHGAGGESLDDRRN